MAGADYPPEVPTEEASTTIQQQQQQRLRMLQQEKHSNGDVVAARGTGEVLVVPLRDQARASGQDVLLVPGSQQTLALLLPSLSRVLRAMKSQAQPGRNCREQHILGAKGPKPKPPHQQRQTCQQGSMRTLPTCCTSAPFAPAKSETVTKSGPVPSAGSCCTMLAWENGTRQRCWRTLRSR